MNHCLLDTARGQAQLGQVAVAFESRVDQLKVESLKFSKEIGHATVAMAHARSLQLGGQIALFSRARSQLAADMLADQVRCEVPRLCGPEKAGTGVHEV